MQGRRGGVAVEPAVPFTAASCSSPPPTPAPPAQAPPAAPQPAPDDTQTPFATAAPLAENINRANQFENFEVTRLSDPTRIDNTWLPLTPGTRFVSEGFTEQAGEREPHRFVQTVTDLAKEITGVAWDQDFVEGELVEAEIAFDAQSDVGDAVTGNPWSRSRRLKSDCDVECFYGGMALRNRAPPE